MRHFPLLLLQDKKTRKAVCITLAHATFLSQFTLNSARLYFAVVCVQCKPSWSSSPCPSFNTTLYGRVRYLLNGQTVSCKGSCPSGTKAVLTCQEFYSKNNNKIPRCLKNGTWNLELPFCAPGKLNYRSFFLFLVINSHFVHVHGLVVQTCTKAGSSKSAGQNSFSFFVLMFCKFPGSF